jgi:hypothetical protein
VLINSNGPQIADEASRLLSPPIHFGPVPNKNYLAQEPNKELGNAPPFCSAFNSSIQSRQKTKRKCELTSAAAAVVGQIGPGFVWLIPFFLLSFLN